MTSHTSSIYRPKHHVYPANACGEPTDNGNVSEADLNKVPFETGPGFVLPYITLIDGRKYAQGNLEVAYQDASWGDSDRFTSEANALAYCERICDELAPMLSAGQLLLPIDISMPGRFVVQVAIPLDGIHHRLDTYHAFERIFGKHATLSEDVASDASATSDRAGLMRKIVEAGQRAGIIRNDLETASVTECWHILECLAPVPKGADQPQYAGNPFKRDAMQPCWEISTAHISKEANDWLGLHAEASAFGLTAGAGCCFEVIPHDFGFIIKVFSGPWTDENLMTNGSASTRADVLAAQRNAGVPESLMNLLDLVAQAEGRFLILDADGSTIEGLPVYDW